MTDLLDPDHLPDGDDDAVSSVDDAAAPADVVPASPPPVPSAVSLPNPVHNTVPASPSMISTEPIQESLRQLFCDLSGLEPQTIDPSVPFIETNPARASRMPAPPWARVPGCVAKAASRS